MVRKVVPLFTVLTLVLGLMGASVSAGPSGDHRDRFLKHERSKVAPGPPSELVAENFDVLGHANLGGGSPNGDIYFYDYGGTIGKYVFVGTWSAPCSGDGVKIVNVNDPTNPKLVAVAGRRTGVSNEDVVVIQIGERVVLGVGVQICKAQGGPGGLALFDVTNPNKPTELGFLPVPAGGVHELDMVARADGTSLALLAVPFTEFDDTYLG